MVDRHRVILHAYCLLTNHYHLMIETPEGNLSKAMRHLNGVYTQRYNRAHRRTGPLFQGRFHASIVEQDAYLLEVARYIALNPVRAGLVEHPGRWKWSSYGATAGMAAKPPWLDVDRVLDMLGRRSKEDARRRYREFVREGMEEVREPGWTTQLIVGGKLFAQEIRKRIDGRKDLQEVPRAQRYAGRPSLEELFAGVNGKEDRNRRIREACLKHGYRLSEVGAKLGLHYSTISHVVNRGENRGEN
jgi:REP element-mobilizing transposase RayT